MSARAKSHPTAIHIRRRTFVTIVLATFLGLAAFLWPFVVAPGQFATSTTPALLFALVLLLVLAVVFAEIAEGGIDSKALAMLGVLSAINAALRPLGAGTAGIETVFFVLVLAGRVFGPGFGFSLGCTSLFASALLTGGVGPWLPYQMFGCAWVGLLAGCLPQCRGRLEIALLAVFGAVMGYLYGLLLNLSFWPFAVDPGSSIAYLPGASLRTQWHRYLLFDATTSMGWDTGRAITNAVLVVVAGPAVLATLRRAARRAAFQAPVHFEDSVQVERPLTALPTASASPAGTLAHHQLVGHPNVGRRGVRAGDAIGQQP